MDTREREKISKKIIGEIIEDISDRSGLSNVWDDMDEDTEEEIKKTWQNIVKRYLPVTKIKL